MNKKFILTQIASVKLIINKTSAINIPSMSLIVPDANGLNFLYTC